jgi:hypothetical protein
MTLRKRPLLRQTSLRPPRVVETHPPTHQMEMAHQREMAQPTILFLEKEVVELTVGTQEVAVGATAMEVALTREAAVGKKAVEMPREKEMAGQVQVEEMTMQQEEQVTKEEGMELIGEEKRRKEKAEVTMEERVTRAEMLEAKVGRKRKMKRSETNWEGKWLIGRWLRTPKDTIRLAVSVVCGLLTGTFAAVPASL